MDFDAVRPAARDIPSDRDVSQARDPELDRERRMPENRSVTRTTRRNMAGKVLSLRFFQRDAAAKRCGMLSTTCPSDDLARRQNSSAASRSKA
jgi:hypothetical protein